MHVLSMKQTTLVKNHVLSKLTNHCCLKACSLNVRKPLLSRSMLSNSLKVGKPLLSRSMFSLRSKPLLSRYIFSQGQQTTLVQSMFWRKQTTLVQKLVLFRWTEGPWVRASPASLRCGPWARHIYPSLVLVQPRKTRPFITERLLMGCKESNKQTI